MSLMIKACLTFLKIGAFAFGGGYAVLSFIQQEVVYNNGWLTPEQYVNIVAIAEMTPGPIAVNSSTFAGYLLDGPLLGVLCTLCIVLIPFILALIVSISFQKVKDNEQVKNALKGIRPAAVGLIAAAGLGIAKAAFVSPMAIIFFAVSAVLLFKFKVNPIIALLSSGALGIVVYGFIL